MIVKKLWCIQCFMYRRPAFCLSILASRRDQKICRRTDMGGDFSMNMESVHSFKKSSSEISLLQADETQDSKIKYDE